MSNEWWFATYLFGGFLMYCAGYASGIQRGRIRQMRETIEAIDKVSGRAHRQSSAS
jgi:hypothetical protein